MDAAAGRDAGAGDAGGKGGDAAIDSGTDARADAGADAATDDAGAETDANVDAGGTLCMPNGESCAGAVLSVCNAEGTEQYTETCEDTTRCKTSIPACERVIGDYTGLGDSVSVLANYLDLQSVYVPAPMTITGLGIVSASATNGQVKLALYADNGSGTSMSFLAQTAAVSAAVVGPVEAPLTAPVTLTPGTYFIGHVFETGMGVVASTSGTWGYYWAAQNFGDPLPDPYVFMGFDGSAKRLGHYAIGYGYSWSVDAGWTCASGTSCQDVYSFDLPASARTWFDVTAVTGASVVRLAVFAPGVALDGTNTLTAMATDRMCNGQDTADGFELDSTGAAGIHRVAVGRDWSSSAGASGTYKLTVSSADVFFPLGATVDDAASQLVTASCPW
jgi:hypothetical protein